MYIIGLTGSIGMGKSTAAAMCRRLGVPVCDSDAIVHQLLGPGGAAVAPVLQGFGDVGAAGGGIDRSAVGRIVFDNPPELRRLEAILHPMVRQTQRRFLAEQARARRRVVVLDIPLLFETGGNRLCDAVIVVTAPRFLQAARVLRRPGMTRARLDSILARQLPDSEKRRRADFVVPSSLGRAETLHRLKRIVRLVRRRSGRVWSPRFPGSVRRA